jgi:hypothetical protein
MFAVYCSGANIIYEANVSLLSDLTKYYWLINNWVRALTVPIHLGLKNGPFMPHHLLSVQGSPDPLLKFQMAPRLSANVLWIQEKGAQMSEAKALNSHKMWAEDSSFSLHHLHKGLLVSSIRWKCLLRVFCPVRRPVTTLDCVLLKDVSLVLAVGLRPEINSRACIWVLPRPRHLAKCCLSFQEFIFLMFCLDTPKDDWGPTNSWTEPSPASLSVNSFPRTPTCPRKEL